MGILSFLLLLAAQPYVQTYQSFTTPTPIPRGEALLIGIVGGWERWDQDNRGVPRLASKLRLAGHRGLHVETVENHRLELALQLIEAAFPDRRSARLILYGQSLGGRAVATLARQLQERGIPVLRTIQVDCFGRQGAVLPPNVREAANLYQRESWPIVGVPRIRAEDPARTRILLNREYRYRGKEIDMGSEGWWRRTFMSSHLKMEYDPEVWREVERLILDAFHRNPGGL
ncbi:MAG: hypothetical protein MUC42_03030 [Bryobacter sp.]|jgi:pimeloyl-ACP methyl ester carboxylesterase|nr:hypothetical protein [Bryobacter sp.]